MLSNTLFIQQINIVEKVCIQHPLVLTVFTFSKILRFDTNYLIIHKIHM